jgi:FMN phosphatase YigB (HAD superfamily)
VTRRTLDRHHPRGKIQWLFFDLGGVLLYFDFWTTCLRLSGVSGKGPSQIYRLGFESGVVQRFDRGQMRTREFYERICELLEIRLCYEDFVLIWCDIFHPNPFMIQMLSALKEEGYSLCLISNTNELHFGFLEKRFSFLTLFDGSTLSYQVGQLKPDEEIFRSAMALAGASPGESVFVDDIEAYVAASCTLGMHGLRYIHGPGVAAELERLGVQMPSFQYY